MCEGKPAKVEERIAINESQTLFGYTGVNLRAYYKLMRTAYLSHPFGPSPRARVAISLV